MDDPKTIMISDGASKHSDECNALEQRIEKITARLPAVIYQYQQRADGSHAFPYVSQGVQRLLGVSPQQLADDATPLFKLIHLEDLARVQASIAQSIERCSNWHEIARVWTLDQRLIWVEAESSPERQPDGGILWYGYLHDVTGRIQTESATREREFFFRESQHAARIGSYKADFLADRWESSEMLDEIFGIDATYCRNIPGWLKLIHPDDQTRMERYLREQVVNCGESFNMEYRIVRPSDRAQRWVLGLGRVASDEQGQSLSMIGTIQDITERKQAEEALRESQRKLLQAQYIAGMGDFEWEVDSGKVYWSEGMYRLLGYNSAEPIDLDKVNASIHHPEDLARVTRWLQDGLISEKDQLEPNEYRLARKDGAVIHVQTNAWISRRDGKALKVFGTCLDITERKEADLQIKLAASVFAHSLEAITITDAANRIIDVNPSFSRITGYSKAEALGQDPNVLASGRHDRDFYERMWEAIETHGFWQGEIWNRRKNGEIYPEMLSISVIRDADGAVQNHIGVFSDISQAKAHEAELDRIAHYDHLTGVPNRRLLTDRLSRAVARAQRTDTLLAVCYLDLDGFKPINDRYGHPTGDRILIQIAKSLQQILRCNDTIARLGGDEFVLLLTELTRPEDCDGLLERILIEIRRPIVVDGIRHSVSGSIGVTLYPPDRDDPDTLLRHADQAMYRAKEAGKNNYHLYDPEQDQALQNRRVRLKRLTQALDHGEFSLHYQPQVDLIEHRVIGAEALIRWQHPDQGLLPPGDFLSDIEGSDLEIALGEWVIDSALRQIEDWNAQGLHLRVGVNIGARHLLQPDFVQRLQSRLSDHPRVDATDLELEILETAALNDFEQARRTLADCWALGVHFALDDFGTGYSSLAYFRTLPVDALKIDQCFVRDMLDDPRDMEIVESVVKLSHAFDRMVIAEGVETLEHAALLTRLGCRFGQGYGIARPMPAQAIPEWVARWSAQQASS